MSADERFDALGVGGANDTGSGVGPAGAVRNDTSGNANERSSNLQDRSTGSNANATSEWSSPASAEASASGGNH
jgi:hypothetical protein